MEAKTIRKNANLVAVGLITYTLLEYLIWTVEPFFQKIYAHLCESDPSAQQQLFEQLQANSNNSGVSSIAAVTIGLFVLFLLFRRKMPPRQLFQHHKKMTGKSFVSLLCVFMSGQLLFSLLGNGIEALLQLCGLTALEQLTTASAQSTTTSMFLYTSLFAPVAEELLYRGFVLRRLQKYGKLFAIVTSAALFGIMHGNLYQMIFAFLVGLVLGYTAITYSIRWSILLHIINNFIFGDILSLILSNFSPTIQDYCSRGINIVFFAVGAWILLRNRDSLLVFYQSNRTEKKCYWHTFTAIGILVFILANLYLAFSGIHSLS